MLKWIVPNKEQGKRLQDFLREKLPLSYSNRNIKREVERGQCFVNGIAERFTSKKLRGKDEIEFNPEGLGQPLEKSTFEQSRILFEDDYLLIYNKPAGVASDEKGIIKLLSPPSLFLTHRLDKETTGALILAKSLPIGEVIAESFRRKEIEKVYLALVDGCPKEAEGVIENRLGKKNAYQGQTLYGKVKQGGVIAKTTWRLLKKAKNASLLECRPQTGRTHQIRVHLAEMGYPILGDYQYGKHFKTKLRPRRLMLHAFKLSFSHPVSKKLISIEAPLAQDFVEAMKEIW